MSTPTLFAGDGEPCVSCGSPLAADQRYCLTCGHRRAAARLPFLEILREDPVPQLIPLGQPIGSSGGPVGGAVPPLAGGTLADRARANTGLIAGVGVLLLAMLIGVLLGAGVGDDNSSASAANQKPVVVSVGGGVAAAAAPAATTATTDAGASTTTPTDTSTDASAASKDSGSSKSADTTPSKAIKPKVVSKSTIKNLDKLSGKEYQKQVDKLGKNIATGGKAPPKDNKPAGGGTASEDIG